MTTLENEPDTAYTRGFTLTEGIYVSEGSYTLERMRSYIQYNRYITNNTRIQLDIGKCVKDCNGIIAGDAINRFLIGNEIDDPELDIYVHLKDAPKLIHIFRAFMGERNFSRVIDNSPGMHDRSSFRRRGILSSLFIKAHLWSTTIYIVDDHIQLKDVILSLELDIYKLWYDGDKIYAKDIVKLRKGEDTIDSSQAHKILSGNGYFLDKLDKYTANFTYNIKVAPFESKKLLYRKPYDDNIYNPVDSMIELILSYAYRMVEPEFKRLGISFWVHCNRFIKERTAGDDSPRAKIKAMKALLESMFVLDDLEFDIDDNGSIFTSDTINDFDTSIIKDPRFQQGNYVHLSFYIEVLIEGMIENKVDLFIALLLIESNVVKRSSKTPGMVQALKTIDIDLDNQTLFGKPFYLGLPITYDDEALGRPNLFEQNIINEYTSIGLTFVVNDGFNSAYMSQYQIPHSNLRVNQLETRIEDDWEVLPDDTFNNQTRSERDRELSERVRDSFLLMYQVQDVDEDDEDYEDGPTTINGVIVGKTCVNEKRVLETLDTRSFVDTFLNPPNRSNPGFFFPVNEEGETSIRKYHYPIIVMTGIKNGGTEIDDKSYENTKVLTSTDVLAGYFDKTLTQYKCIPGPSGGYRADKSMWYTPIITTPRAFLDNRDIKRVIGAASYNLTNNTKEPVIIKLTYKERIERVFTRAAAAPGGSYVSNYHCEEGHSIDVYNLEILGSNDESNYDSDQSDESNYDSDQSDESNYDSDQEF